MRRNVVVLALLCLFVLSIAGIHSSMLAATGGHGCAPPVPPGIPNTVPAPAAPSVVVFNEMLTTPHSTWNCSESGVYFLTTDSWIELYNTQNQSYNLYAARAYIDSGPNTNAFTFPFNASIAAHSYLVVFPYTNSSFFATKTSTLRLIISNVVIDQVLVPTLGQDQSYARMPDGSSTWQVTSLPTIDASNASLTTPTAGTLPGTPVSSPVSSPAVAFGTQPSWNKLLMPTPTLQLTLATSPTPAASTVANSTAPATNTGLGLFRQIILTLLLAGLGGALLWWWRSSRPPKEKKT